MQDLIRSEIVSVSQRYSIDRRTVLRDFARTSAFIGILPALACKGDIVSPAETARFVKSTPVGALNLMYAHVLLMADLYARVDITSAPYVGMTAIEQSMLRAIGRDKKAQVAVLRQLIPSGRIADVLLFNFNSLDFSTRESILAFAKKFEDLGVALANNLIQLLGSAEDVILMSKIGSVCARHATVVRDFYNLFVLQSQREAFAGSDVIERETGANVTIDIDSAIAEMQPYFVTRLIVR